MNGNEKGQKTSEKQMAFAAYHFHGEDAVFTYENFGCTMFEARENGKE